MRIKLVDADNRLSIKYNTVDGIYNWGADNAYSSLVKSVISSSVTAKQCVDLNSKYIYGKGFEFAAQAIDKSGLIVNKRGININQLLRIVSREFSEQNNIFLHVNYNALFQVISVDLVSCEVARIGKADSTGYNGKYVLYNNWDKSKSKRIEKKDFLVVDRFNPNPTAIEKQVEFAGGWNRYKGQILHVNSDFSELYSMSDVDSVLYDADSEHQAAIFKNSGLRKGFFGVKIFTTKPFLDDYARKDFTDTMHSLQGPHNTGILHLEANLESDNLDEHLKIENIDSNIDDKQFESTEKSSANNIRKAFGVPSILVEDSDNSIFGNSGELLTQAKLMFWENKEEERNIISDAFQMLFSNFHKPINQENNWTITPIVQKAEPATPNE